MLNASRHKLVDNSMLAHLNFIYMDLSFVHSHHTDGVHFWAINSIYIYNECIKQCKCYSHRANMTDVVKMVLRVIIVTRYLRIVQQFLTIY